MTRDEITALIDEAELSFVECAKGKEEARALWTDEDEKEYGSFDQFYDCTSCAFDKRLVAALKLERQRADDLFDAVKLTIKQAKEDLAACRELVAVFKTTGE
jgi:hypothetical protein